MEKKRSLLELRETPAPYLLNKTIHNGKSPLHIAVEANQPMLIQDMLENDKILIEDFDLITELSSFISRKSSYEAEEGAIVSAFDHEGFELVRLEMAPELSGSGIADRLDVTLGRLEASRLDTI